VQQAREHQAAADQARRLAANHLAQRDHLVRSLYREGDWSYSRLARALGLTPELVAKIIRPQAR
jgi:plasmid maintenance system antidote protein VapI